MTTSLDIKTAPIEGFKGIELAVSKGTDNIFHATRYDDQKYAIVAWHVNPAHTKDQYLTNLIEFYNLLETGNLKTRGTRGLPIGIMLDSISEHIPINQLEGNPPSIATHPRYQDFALLRIDSSYGVLTMEDFTEPKGWKSDSGLLTVITHQDISSLLAPFINQTARTKANTNEIQGILSREVYTFQR